MHVHRARRVWWCTCVVDTPSVQSDTIIIPDMSQTSRLTYPKQRKLDRLKGESSESSWRLVGCDQRDANLCVACARPTDERSLAKGGGGEQRG